MRAKFITEKFTEESDPVKDMGIGGLNPKEEINRLFQKLIEELKIYLYQFIGKRITGKLHPHYASEPNSKITTGRIKDIRINMHLSNRNICFIDEDDMRYFLLEDENEKLFIEE